MYVQYMYTEYFWRQVKYTDHGYGSWPSVRRPLDFHLLDHLSQIHFSRH